MSSSKHHGVWQHLNTNRLGQSYARTGYEISSLSAHLFALRIRFLVHVNEMAVRKPFNSGVVMALNGR